MRVVLCICLMLFSIINANAGSQQYSQQSQNEGYNLGKSMNEYHRTGSDIQNKYANPVQGATKMQTVGQVYVCSNQNIKGPYGGGFYTQAECNQQCTGGTCSLQKVSFDAKLQCQSTKELIKLQLATVSGSEGSVAVSFDLNLDGQWDYHRVTHSISGVCTNGYYSCNPPGSKTGCSYYTPAIRHKCGDGNVFASYSVCESMCRSKPCTPIEGEQIQFVSTDATTAGVCICTNAACGQTFNQNIQDIFMYLGSAISQLVASTYNLGISDTKFDPNTMTLVYNAIDSTSCSSLQNSNNINQLKQAYQTGNLDGSGELLTQMNDPNSNLSALMTQQTGGTINSCKITNTPIMNTLLGYGKIEASPVTLYGYVCGARGAQWPSAKATFVFQRFDGTVFTVGPLNTSTFCNDHNPIIEIGYDGDQAFIYGYGIGGNIVFNNCWDYGKQRILDAPVYPDATLKEIYVEMNPAGGCRGSGSVTFQAPQVVYTKIQNQHNNQCITFENNKDCRLKTEKINGIYTVKNYNKTPTVMTNKCQNLTYRENNTTYTVCDGSTIHVKSATGIYRITSAGDVISSTQPAYFEIEREYFCKSKDNQDVSWAKDQPDKVGRTLNPETTTYQYYKDGQIQSGDVGWYPKLDINCQYTCTVAYRPHTDTTVNYQMNTRPDTNSNWADKEERACIMDGNNVWNCPIKDGENIVKNCRCESTFSESISLFNAVSQAAKDIICSSQ